MHHYHYGTRQPSAESLVRRENLAERISTRSGHNQQYHLPKASTTTALLSSINVSKWIWNAVPKDLVSMPHINAFKRLVQRSEIYALVAESVEAVRRMELCI
uniref:Uncharacterized protein n=1 Tax=Acrobeloides nanus TaxID=290746 RepID=A0A914C567_9BILA